MDIVATDWIGLAGSAVIVVAYFLNQRGQLASGDWRFPALNLVGAALILFSLMFTWGSTMSFGPSGASINGMKFAVPKLVHGITHDLFTADLDARYASLKAYDTPEFEITAEQRCMVLAAD